MKEFIAVKAAKWYGTTEIIRGCIYFMFGEALFVYGLSYGSWWLTFYYLILCLALWFSADYVQKTHHEWYSSLGYTQGGLGSNQCWWSPDNIKIPRYSDID